MSLELCEEVAPPRSAISASSTREPAAGGVGSDAGAVDAAADNDEIVDHGGKLARGR